MWRNRGVTRRSVDRERSRSASARAPERDGLPSQSWSARSTLPPSSGRRATRGIPIMLQAAVMALTHRRWTGVVASDACRYTLRNRVRRRSGGERRLCKLTCPEMDRLRRREAGRFRVVVRSRLGSATSRRAKPQFAPISWVDVESGWCRDQCFDTVEAMPSIDVALAEVSLGTVGSSHRGS